MTSGKSILYNTVITILICTSCTYSQQKEGTESKTKYTEMQDSIDQNIESLFSADADERSSAINNLVNLGKEVSNALLTVAQNQENLQEARLLAIEGLGEVGNLSLSEPMYELTLDEDPKIRSKAATGLLKIGDERALDALIKTIDDYPDILHSNYTLSMYGLMGLGESALSSVSELLKSKSVITRSHANTVIQTIIHRNDPDALKDLQGRFGKYDPKDPNDENRNKLADQWINHFKQK